MYTLGLVSVSFRKHSPKTIIEEMKKTDLSVIEWGSDVHATPEKVNEIAVLQKEYGIKCSSYGTYFRLGSTPLSDLKRYIDGAKSLGTDILRLWCGNKDSEKYSFEEKDLLFSTCKNAAKIAKENGVILCMECHNNTFTNRKDSAIELMKEINSEHFLMYWQPNQYKTVDENIEYAKAIAPYTKHLHVFNWEGTRKYPLADAKNVWQKYLDCFSNDKTLLLEFMPDDSLGTLKTEAEALGDIIK